MRAITPEQTSLSELGMTLDIVLSGEKVDFDPETKINKRANDYVLLDFAKKVADAYADDLLAAYRAIEELEQEVDQLREELGETAQAAETSAGQAKQLLKGEQEFADAEKLLAKFEQQLEAFAADKRIDKETIEKLNRQVRELKELGEKVPQLEADVNEVLANLRSYFEEEGISMPDPGEDDDYLG